MEGDETGTKFHVGVNWSCKINDLKLVVSVLSFLIVVIYVESLKMGLNSNKH